MQQYYYYDIFRSLGGELIDYRSAMCLKTSETAKSVQRSSYIRLKENMWVPTQSLQSVRHFQETRNGIGTKHAKKYTDNLRFVSFCCGLVQTDF